jgi:hypothetical protein
MVKNILSLNVSFAVVLLNGSAGTLWFNSGVIPTSVRVVTKSNVRVSISASIRRTSFRNVKGRPDVLLEEIIKATVMKNLWDVLSAGISNKLVKVSEWNCWSLWRCELPNYPFEYLIWTWIYTLIVVLFGWWKMQEDQLLWKTDSFYIRSWPEYTIIWGRSSNGRALDSKSKGCEFKSRRSHFLIYYLQIVIYMFNGKNYIGLSKVSVR